MNDNKESYPKKPSVGRGFFAVLMLCLIAVGGVAATTFTDSPGEPPLDTAQSTTAAPMTTTTAKPVDVKPATTTTAPSTTTVTTTAATPIESLFVLPLSNKVLTPYSTQPLYNEIMDSYRVHTAVDFDGEEGQPIRPLANGTVTAVEQDRLWGGCVTVDHGAGVISVYRGVVPSVDVGDELTTDEHLGTLGAVPCESNLGPHLHLELYKDGVVSDATILFEKQIVYN